MIINEVVWRTVEYVPFDRNMIENTLDRNEIQLKRAITAVYEECSVGYLSSMSHQQIFSTIRRLQSSVMIR